jgi:RimJ/RimL family protein N-acetyltransferase
MNQHILITPEAAHFATLFRWKLNEPHPESFTCRPVPATVSYEEYVDKFHKRLENPASIEKTLISAADGIIKGSINAYDYNPRNQSIEFGYYLPPENRGMGYGTLMTALFLKYLLLSSKLDIYKVYATTSSDNAASIKLLEKFNFRLDGRNRAHYWIDECKYDQLVYSLIKPELELVISSY